MFGKNKDVVVEFDVEGRTYRVEAPESVLFTRDLGGNHAAHDLISGQRLVVNWGLLSVIRVVEG